MCQAEMVKKRPLLFTSCIIERHKNCIFHPHLNDIFLVMEFDSPIFHCANLTFYSCFSQESIGSVARQYKQHKKATVREEYKVAQSLLDRLRRVSEDVRGGKCEFGLMQYTTMFSSSLNMESQMFLFG